MSQIDGVVSTVGVALPSAAHTAFRICCRRLGRAPWLQPLPRQQTSLASFHMLSRRTLADFLPSMLATSEPQVMKCSRCAWSCRCPVLPIHPMSNG